MNKPPSKIKKHRVRRAVFIMAAAVCVYIVASNIYLRYSSDGTNNFTGVKRVAAQNAIRHIDAQRSGNWAVDGFNIIFSEKLRVINVVPDPDFCIGGKNPNQIEYYDVVVEDRDTIPLPYATTKWRGCILTSDL